LLRRQLFLRNLARKRASSDGRGRAARFSASSRAMSRRAHARSRIERVALRGFQ
jgi:hypothetical protein